MGRRKYDVLGIVILVVGIVAFASFRSEFRLRSDMPVEFFDGQRVPREKRSAEEKVARAYWDCAVKEVQWKYGYAHRLPEDPPPEFSLSAVEVGAVAKDESVRRFYWQKLRSTWNVAALWKSQWEWNFVTFRQSLRTGGDWWKELVRSIVGQ
jgi:hypothetical protein